MAIVRHLEKQQLETESTHTETACTYSVVKDRDGRTRNREARRCPRYRASLFNE